MQIVQFKESRENPFNHLAEFTTAPLGLDDGLVAGPEEIFLPDQSNKPAAFHHGARIFMDTGKHQRAALFVDPFIEAVDHFQPGRVDQRHAAHGQDQGMSVAQAGKCFIELACRCKEQWAGQEGHAHVTTMPGILDPALAKFFSIHFGDLNFECGNVVQEHRA